MTFDEYSQQARLTAQYGGSRQECLSYVTIALAGETGEYCNEIQKCLKVGRLPNEAERERCLEELGDTLWCLTMNAHEQGTTLDAIAQANLEKLQKRYMRKGD